MSEEVKVSGQQTLTIQQAIDLGVEHHKAGRLLKAESIYRQILQTDPNHPVALHLLGVIAHQVEENIVAEEFIAKAIEINPEYAEAYSNLGNVLRKLGRTEDAVKSYQRALSLRSDMPEALTNLGNALRDLGQLDKATKYYRKAISLDADYSAAHSNLSSCQEHHVYSDEIRAMEELFDRSEKSSSTRLDTAFGLGKAFEDLGRYNEAFDFYVEGNKIKRSTFSYSVRDDELFVVRSKSVFNRELYRGVKNAGYKSRAPIFILGMPRSGTSLVEQILSAHKEISAAGELPYIRKLCFPSDKDGKGGNSYPENVIHYTREDIRLLGSKYAKQLKARAPKAKNITDKMPGNFLAIGFIKLILPNARIIHCARNPADTCASIFKMNFAAGLPYAYDQIEIARYYNLYSDIMKHWHTVFPGYIFDLHYEDLVSGQEEQSKRLIDYCGLDWDSACLDFHKTDRPVATASSTQVRRPIYKSSVQSWKQYEKQLAPLLEALTG